MVKIISKIALKKAKTGKYSKPLNFNSKLIDAVNIIGKLKGNNIKATRRLALFKPAVKAATNAPRPKKIKLTKVSIKIKKLNCAIGKYKKVAKIGVISNNGKNTNNQ